MKKIINYPCLEALAFEIEEGIMITNANKIIEQVNSAFTRITGYSADEVIGQHPQLLCSGIDDSTFYQDMWVLINHQNYWQGEIRNRRKNGEIFPEWLTITSVLDAQGQPHFIGSFTDLSAHKQKELQSLEAYKQRELQFQLELQQKNIELQQIKIELNDINSALKTLLKHQQSESLASQEVLEQEISQEIIPFLHQLKRGHHHPKQDALIHILETNLRKISSSYGSKNSISRLYKELTPKEIQVASMIRQGFSSKYIAITLSMSEATVNVHRKNIRKKLDLDNQAINLRSYLISFD